MLSILLSNRSYAPGTYLSPTDGNITPLSTWLSPRLPSPPRTPHEWRPD